MFTMSSDTKQTRHNRLEMAFKSASAARNEGATGILIEDEVMLGHLYERFSYCYEKSSDGVFVRLSGTITPYAVKQIEVYCLRYGLPFTAQPRMTRVD